jgi:ligand-binding SRPBCC domain-containing protein
MATIEIETHVDATPERCFDLARDLDLHLRSMQQTRERAVGGRTSGMIGPNEEVTWEGRHFGILHRHTSRITRYDRPRHFRDSMVRGRFARFEHDHFFEPLDGGTLMRDVVAFASPCGPLGRLVDGVLLARYLTRLIVRRNAAIKREAELAP